jgi:hypothetical protein
MVLLGSRCPRSRMAQVTRLMGLVCNTAGPFWRAPWLFGVLAAVVTGIVPADAESRSECLQAWANFKSDGLVQNTQVAGGYAVITVDQSAWNSLPYAEKVGLVDTLRCAMLSAGSQAPISIMSHRINTIIAEWRCTPGGCDLTLK